ncbi:MAG: glycosyltransferase family 39 protein [Xanthobacteraceae bacterium]|nr:glycosyltransferase family 39 protein [Xanthobacteraceae bacterium]
MADAPSLADDPRAFRIERAAMRVVERVRAEHRETILLAALLAGFAIAWFVFDVVSLGSLDAHYDLSEMSIWAQHFAFGYKHPPLSGWVFGLWFSVFPRTAWAAHLLAVSTITITLAITWRLLRDHLDFNRALLGIASLTLVPLYTFQAIKFNANLVMMPFWAAALLFYLRARRTLRGSDAALAGACLGFAFLGKYWAIYLVAGVFAASFTGATARPFWRSRAPYAMAAAALVVVAPHLVWLLTERGGDTDSFLLSLRSADPFSADVVRSVMFLIGSAADVIAPLLILAALRPNRAAMADTIAPQEEGRKLALVLLLVPLALPALVNLAMPHRLTPLWTFPNWALLPVVLFGSPLLNVPALAATRTALIAAVVTIASVIVAPFIGIQHLQDSNEQHRQHWQQLAREIGKLSDKPVGFLTGDGEILKGLYFLLPSAQPLPGATFTPADSNTRLAIICLSNDAACQSQGDMLAQEGWTQGQWAEVKLTRSFLGASGPATAYRIKIVSRK